MKVLLIILVFFSLVCTLYAEDKQTVYINNTYCNDSIIKNDNDCNHKVQALSLNSDGYVQYHVHTLPVYQDPKNGISNVIVNDRIDYYGKDDYSNHDILLLESIHKESK